MSNERRIALLLVVLSLASSVAEAQTRRFRAGAGFVADRVPELTTGMGTSWSLMFGADIARDMGVRLVVEGWRDASGWEDAFVQPRQPLPVQRRHRETKSTSTVAFLLDSRWRVVRRTHIGVLYGVAIVDHGSSVTTETREIQADGTLSPPSSTPMRDSHERIAAPVGGVEMAIGFGRVELVPEFRIIQFVFSDSSEPSISRAVLGVRYRF